MCASRIFLTGQPGIGKTTAIRLIARDLERRGKRVGGMISSEIRDAGGRVGFQLEDISTHKVGILAHLQEKLRDTRPTVGKYYVNLHDIEKIGAAAIRNAVNIADVIIIDEIGPMELKSKEFNAAVEFALASEKSLVATIHRLSTHPLISSIKSNANCRLIEVTFHNRDHIPSEVVGIVIGQAP
jgi:nucleoside-triphosphatase